MVVYHIFPNLIYSEKIFPRVAYPIEENTKRGGIRYYTENIGNKSHQVVLR